MSDTKQSRVHVTLEDFLRVVIVEREQFPTIAQAASELGMTEGSLKQRITREKKNMPKVFDGVPRYSGSSGPHRHSEEDALALLASLRKDTSEESEGPKEDAQ